MNQLPQVFKNIVILFVNAPFSCIFRNIGGVFMTLPNIEDEDSKQSKTKNAKKVHHIYFIGS